MNKRYFKPNNFLSTYIDRYWMWEYKAETEFEMPLIFPGTGLELFIHLHQPFSINNEKLPQAHIACPRQYATINPVNDLKFIAIRFRSGAFRHFSPVPFSEINNAFIGLEEIWGQDALAFLNILNEQATNEAYIKVIESFLTQQYHRFQKGDAKFWDMAINKLYYNFESVQLETLANEKNISYRHFERGFKAQFGITPKRFQTISRFQNTVKKLLLTKQKMYLPVALDNGYFDQAHFIKEFETYTGYAPSAFLIEKNFMSHFYNTSLK